MVTAFPGESVLKNHLITGVLILASVHREFQVGSSRY